MYEGDGFGQIRSGVVHRADFRSSKALHCGGTPMPKDVLLYQHRQGGCNACIAGNELSIVISEPHKQYDGFDTGGSLPLMHCIQFVLYRSDPSGCHPLTEELKLLHVDETLRSLGINLLLIQWLKFQL